jgi:hypothetical protein
MLKSLPNIKIFLIGGTFYTILKDFIQFLVIHELDCNAIKVFDDGLVMIE